MDIDTIPKPSITGVSSYLDILFTACSILLLYKFWLLLYLIHKIINSLHKTKRFDLFVFIEKVELREISQKILNYLGNKLTMVAKRQTYFRTRLSV